MLKKRLRTSIDVPTSRRFFDRSGDDAPFDVDLEPLGRFERAALATDFGHLGDRRQRLAAKAEGPHAIEVAGLAELAGGVRLKGQRQVFAIDPLAVVGEANEVFPPRSTTTSMREAPASIAFSSSSLTTLAGRSTTSPAAIWLMTEFGSSLMIPNARALRVRSNPSVHSSKPRGGTTG